MNQTMSDRKAIHCVLCVSFGILSILFFIMFFVNADGLIHGVMALIFLALCLINYHFFRVKPFWERGAI